MPEEMEDNRLKRSVVSKLTVHKAEPFDVITECNVRSYSTSADNYKETDFIMQCRAQPQCRRTTDPKRMGEAVAPSPGAALGGKVLTGVLSLSFSVRLVLFTIQYGQKITTSRALLAKSICVAAPVSMQGTNGFSFSGCVAQTSSCETVAHVCDITESAFSVLH